MQCILVVSVYLELDSPSGQRLWAVRQRRRSLSECMNYRCCFILVDAESTWFVVGDLTR